MQVDVAFGDVIVPAPQETQFPAMLDFPSARLLAYPREAVIAEKLEALVKLGIANTRMKDFYDLWQLSREFDFDGALLSDAIEATFKRRRTEIPSGTPLALTDEFSRDSQKAKQWQAFVKKSNLDHDQATLDDVAADLTRFIMPPLQAIYRSQQFALTWSSRGPWSPPIGRH
jgi:predicted nucleotidyltransferase component of viral defense system